LSDDRDVDETIGDSVVVELNDSIAVGYMADVAAERCCNQDAQPPMTVSPLMDTPNQYVAPQYALSIPAPEVTLSVQPLSPHLPGIRQIYHSVNVVMSSPSNGVVSASGSSLMSLIHVPIQL